MVNGIIKSIKSPAFLGGVTGIYVGWGIEKAAYSFGGAPLASNTARMGVKVVVAALGLYLAQGRGFKGDVGAGMAAIATVHLLQGFGLNYKFLNKPAPAAS